MKAYADEVDHTREVITAFELVSNYFKSAQIYSPTYEKIAEKDYYLLYKKETESINDELEKLKLLTRDNREQHKRIETLSLMINAHIPHLKEKNIVELIEAKQGWRLRSFFRIHEIINEGISHEQELLRLRKNKLQESTQLTRLLTILFSVIAIGLIAWTFISTLFINRKRKWLEGFLESILNTSLNGVVNYKALRRNGKITDFKIEFANKALEPIHGIKPDMVIGKKISELASFVSHKEVLDRYINVVETGEQQQFEILYKKDAIKKWLLVLLAKQSDGLTASFHNISDIKHYQEELHTNIKSLEHSNIELEQYAYVASHDLQEPLRKIRTYGSYLLENQTQNITEKGISYIEKMLNAAERMSNLIANILSFSSLKRETVFETINLNEILKQVLEDLELLITQKSAIINIDELPQVDGIPLQMHQLFYNLVNNALKFTRENTKPIISITSRIVPAREIIQNTSLPAQIPYCEIIVADNGTGFPVQFEEEIFALFKRLGTRQNSSGSGIGLALCRKVVSNHNGTITAKGKENEGARFIILLPIRQLNAEQI